MAKGDKPDRTSEAVAKIDAKLAQLVEHRAREIEEHATELVSIDADATRLQALRKKLTDQPDLADLIAEMRALQVID